MKMNKEEDEENSSLDIITLIYANCTPLAYYFILCHHFNDFEFCHQSNREVLALLCHQFRSTFNSAEGGTLEMTLFNSIKITF